MSLQEDLCSEFLRPEKIHRPQPGLTRKPWILRRARYPETTEANTDFLQLKQLPTEYFY